MSVREFLGRAINLLGALIEIAGVVLYLPSRLAALITLPMVAILVLCGQASLALSFLKGAALVTLAFTAIFYTLSFTVAFLANEFYHVNYAIHTVFNRILYKYFARPTHYLDQLIDKIYSSLFNSLKQLLNPFYQFCKFKSLQVRTAFNIYFYKEPAFSPSKYIPIVEYAVKHGHVDRLRWLQARGVDVYFYDSGIFTSEGSFLLREAINNRQPEVVNFLLETVLLNNPTWDITCQNFLILAVSANHVGMTQALLNKMTLEQVDRAIRLAPASLNIINFPVIHQYKLTQLQKSLYDKMYPLVAAMYQSDYRAIVEPNLVYDSIMNMLPNKPDWCTKEKHNALCIEVFDKAKTIFFTLNKPSSSASSAPVLTPAVAPVVFTAALASEDNKPADQNIAEEVMGPEVSVRVI